MTPIDPITPAPSFIIPVTLIQAGTGEDGITTITYKVKPEDIKGIPLHFYQESFLEIHPPSVRP